MSALTRRSALSATPGLMLAPTALLASEGTRHAASRQPRALVAQLRAHCDHLALADGFHGVVLLMQRGRTLFEKAYGLRNRAEQLANRIDTRFNIASVGKLFTALCILRLAAGGHLKLDAPLIEAWPDYPDPEVARRITVAQILTHTSGLGNHVMFKPKTGFSPAARQLDYVALFAREGLSSEVGGPASYSNDGYVLLAALVERLTGQDFRRHCQTTIFDPLGMTGTGFDPPGDIVPNAAIPYGRDLSRPGVWQAQVNSDSPVPGGFGGGHSTAGDLARFGAAMAANQLLDPQMTRLWTTSRVSFRQGGYGYGTQTEQINGHHLYGHTGGHYGVAAELLIVPDTGHLFVVLSNSEVEPYWDLANTVRVLIAGTNPAAAGYDGTRQVAEAARTGGLAAAQAVATALPQGSLREGMLDTYAFRYWHEGQSGAAEALLTFNLAQFPQSLLPVWSIAEYYRFAGRVPEAIGAYRRFLERQPGDTDALRFIEQLQARVTAPAAARPG